MKRLLLKLIVVSFLLILTGCAQYYPESAFLDLSVSPQKPETYDGSLKASIIGYDNRPNRALLFYQLDDENIEIPSAAPLQTEIIQKLIDGYSSQGLFFNDNAKIQLSVTIDAMAIKVSEKTWTYECVATTQLEMKVSTPQGTFTKKFNREDQQTTFFRPDPKELEKMIGEQVSDLLDTILRDRSISEAIRQ